MCSNSSNAESEALTVIGTFEVCVCVCACMCVYICVCVYIYNIYMHVCAYIYMCVCVCVYIYRVSQEERTKLRKGVPYVKVYRYNPKHLYPKLNGYGDNGKRSLKF